MPVNLFIPLLFLIISSFLVYFLIVYLFPVSESQQIFLEMYVPHEDREKKRFTAAFIFIRLALLLWIFRAFSWITQMTVAYQFSSPIEALKGEEPFIEISNYALGGAYLLALLAAAIMMPYVRKKLVRRRKFEPYIRRRFLKSKSDAAGGMQSEEKNNHEISSGDAEAGPP